MIDRIDHIVINCRDVDRTADWYVQVLGFTRESYGKGRTALRFGQQKFNVRQTGTSDWFTCATDAPGALDMCFVTSGSIGEVVDRWTRLGIPIEHGPVPMQGALGTMTSVYCRDPDGNLVEVASYADAGA